jgi:membrane protein required for colicin V production
MATLTLFDFIVLGLIVISLSIGVWRGVVSEILALIAWVAAFLAARAWGARVGDWTDIGLVDPFWRHIAGFLEVFVGVLVLFALARWLMTLMLKAVGLRPLDRVLGAVFGVARGLLVAWAAVLLSGFTALPQETWWRQAVLAPPLETAVIATKPWLPPDLAKRIRYR